jgi:hypothetical protein
MKYNEELYQVDVGYACFGVIVKDNIVVGVAPVGKWMLGKKFDEVDKWVNGKKGNIVKI